MLHQSSPPTPTLCDAVCRRPIQIVAGTRLAARATKTEKDRTKKAGKTMVYSERKGAQILQLEANLRFDACQLQSPPVDLTTAGDLEGRRRGEWRRGSNLWGVLTPPLFRMHRILSVLARHGGRSTQKGEGPPLLGVSQVFVRCTAGRGGRSSACAPESVGGQGGSTRINLPAKPQPFRAVATSPAVAFGRHPVARARETHCLRRRTSPQPTRQPLRRSREIPPS